MSIEQLSVNRYLAMANSSAARCSPCTQETQVQIPPQATQKNYPNFNVNKLLWAIGKSASARNLTWTTKRYIRGHECWICMWIPAACAPSMESHRTTEVEQINKHYQVWMVELRVRLSVQIWNRITKKNAKYNSKYWFNTKNSVHFKKNKFERLSIICIQTFRNVKLQFKT